MLIEFSRDFCLPCQVMAPDIATIQQKYAASIDVVTLNLDREDHTHFAVFFQIETVPSQIYVDSVGKLVAKHDGLASIQEMERLMAGLGWIP